MTHKILINISLIGIFTAQTLPASAVTKCVKLNATSTCTNTSGITSNQSDWSANCGGTEIRGIGVCGANDDNLSTAQKTDILNTKASDNTFCYCKMITPAVSQWVFLTELGTGCQAICSQRCLGGVLATGNQVIRNALFSAPFSD